jgi:hypothetical protein
MSARSQRYEASRQAVFPAADGGPLNPTDVTDEFRRVVERAG